METLPSYDLVPYESLPSPACHPDRLFTMGSLFGLSPRPITDCRVLELGSSDGGNLLPMAINLPHSEFIGIDLSARQIDMGRTTLKALGVTNMRLEHRGILDLDHTLGTFDYIICHGVFSWVSGEVQEKILAVFSDHLAENGIAYVDYNTYPGWSAIEPLRHLMRYHTDGLDDPRACVGQALSILDLVGHFIQSEDVDYANFIKKEIERIKKVGTHMEGGAYVFHEYLEDVNTPLYFHQFAQKATDHGLQYLGEAIYAHMLTHGFPPQVADTLAALGDDILLLEQYMDFLRNRRFRNSLLCRQGPSLDRKVKPEDVMPFKVVCTKGVNDEVLKNAEGGPLIQAALKILVAQRPRAMSFDRLFQEVAGIHGISPLETETARYELARELARLYPLNVIQLLSRQADFILDPGPRPELCPLALYQISRKQRWLSNQCHEPAILSRPLYPFASLLNGQNDRGRLADYIKKEIDNDTISLTDHHCGTNITAENINPADLDSVLDNMLDEIARKALLVA